MCSWIGGLNIVKMSTVPKAMYRLNTMLVKMPVGFFFLFFYKNIKNNPQVHLELQSTLNSQNNLEKETKWGDIILSGFKIYQKATLIRTVCYWHKDRHVD